MLKKYIKAKNDIFNYFNYNKEIYKIMSIEDYTDFYYKYIEKESKIYYSTEYDKNNDYEFWDNVIEYYVGDEYIMFLIENFDNDKYLNIFDKNKNLDIIEDDYNIKKC